MRLFTPRHTRAIRAYLNQTRRLPKRLLGLGLGLWVLMIGVAQAGPVGVQQTTFNVTQARPLETVIWYPASSNASTTVPTEILGDNPVFAGIPVLNDAPMAAGQHPLALLSHGYRGNWRNLNWLAGRLAAHGWIVAAVNHPGTTTFNTQPAQAAQWWARPQDISHLLDHLMQRFSHQIDPDQISAIGHSLGGWTVLQLAGARLDPAHFVKDCEAIHEVHPCNLKSELGLNQPHPQAPVSNDLHDARIKRVVSLDLGLARSFSPESLSQIRTPVLILAAGIDINALPQTMESGYLADYIPKQYQQYDVIPGATHFSFVQVCKPGAKARLNQEIPGDGIICLDGQEVDRQALHDQMFNDILPFLEAPVGTQ